jgi:hypothetical protein
MNLKKQQEPKQLRPMATALIELEEELIACKQYNESLHEVVENYQNSWDTIMQDIYDIVQDQNPEDITHIKTVKCICIVRNNKSVICNCNKTFKYNGVNYYYLEHYVGAPNEKDSITTLFYIDVAKNLLRFGNTKTKINTLKQQSPVVLEA